MQSISSRSPKEIVRLIAWLLILMGAVDFTGAAIANVFSLLQYGRGFNAGGSGWIFILAGIGLLKRRRGWRTFVLFICWCHFLLAPGLLVGAFYGLKVSEFTFAGGRISFGQSPTIWCLSGVLNLVFLVFTYFVLLRPDVAQYFKGEATLLQE